MSHGVVTGLLSGVGTATAGWVIAVTTSAIRIRARERRIANEAARNAVKEMEHTMLEMRYRIDKLESILWSIEERSHRVRHTDKTPGGSHATGGQMKSD